MHTGGVVATAVHAHEHTHSGKKHSHRHHHEAFVQARAELIVTHASRGTLVGHLAAVAVPFGVAASPDLSFLPLGLAASAYGASAVAAVLGVFAILTMATFVGLTVIATAAGYQMQGEWLEKHVAFRRWPVVTSVRCSDGVRSRALKADVGNYADADKDQGRHRVGVLLQPFALHLISRRGGDDGQADEGGHGQDCEYPEHRCDCARSVGAGSKSEGQKGQVW